MDLTLDPFAAEAEVYNKIVGSVFRAAALEGDIAVVEGMGNGGSIPQFIASAMSVADRSFVVRTKKTLHLFGRFSPDDDPIDPVDLRSPFVVSGRWTPGHHDGAGAEDMRRLCAQHLDPARICVHPGRPAATIAETPTTCCVVFMGCRLYGPTRDVLTALFTHKRIAEGALITFSDWNANRAAPRFGERRAWAECVERFGIDYSDGGDFGLSSKMMVIHDYAGAPVIRGDEG
jgi:hypothetical protein